MGKPPWDSYPSHFRRSILSFASSTPYLFIFDAATIVLGAFCSAAALLVLFLLNSAMSKALEQYNKHVKEMLCTISSVKNSPKGGVPAMKV